MRWHHRYQTCFISVAFITMDGLTVCGIHLSPVKDFDQIEEIRAERHEHLRGRNNVTSCRSPTRHFNSIVIKSELRKKRHLEYQRRRSVSPELCGLWCKDPSSMAKPSTKTFSTKRNSSFSESETLHANMQNTATANEHPVMVLTQTPNWMTDGPSTSKWAPLWSDQVTLVRQAKGQARITASTSTPAIMETTQHRMKSIENIEKSVNAQKRSIKSFTQTEKIQQRFSVQTENMLHKKMLRETSVQTESGLVTVNESDVQQLADYLQEALWREEAVRNKLSALRESTSKLTNSSKLIWTARHSEDLLRNKIRALEAQLQVCLQSPKDGVKKLVLQMEKRKLVYEEKALDALQRATRDKIEALCKAEAMQEGLITAKAEAVTWQSLYEELKLSTRQLMEIQLLNKEQLQQLHSQVELFRATEGELREEVLSLGQEMKELQYNICLQEEDNQTLREEIEHLRDDNNNKSQDFMMQLRVASEEAESRSMTKRDSQVEEQLCHTQEKLRLKESECQELQTELDAMELECQSSQARLSQCRDELRQLVHYKRRTLCGSWWKVLMVFPLFLIVAGVAMLWLWYPPFREQVEELFSEIEKHVEDYLMTSPHYFRPI